MSDDEKAIRELVDRWMKATEHGDTATVLSLMSDDVVFMAPGQEPFGKEAFATAAAGAGGSKIEGRCEILELKVLGDWAFIRNRIELTITPPGQEALHQRGYTLSLLRKDPDGTWRLARDANLVTRRG